MPDSSKNIHTAFDQLDNQIIDMVGNYVKRRRQHYEEAAKKLHAELKKDAARYTEMAAEGTITGEELEHLVKGRWAQLKIELLAETSLAKSKVEGIAGDVLKLTLSTAFQFV